MLDQHIGSPVVISSSAGGRSGQKAEFLATMAEGAPSVFIPDFLAARYFVGPTRGCAGSVGNVNDTFSVAITIVDDVVAFASGGGGC